MTTTQTTGAHDVISDEAWETFWVAQKATYAAAQALIDDPPSRRLSESMGDGQADLMRAFYGLTDLDDEVDKALKNLQDNPELPKHDATTAIKPNAEQIRDATVNADKEVHLKVDDLKKKVQDKKDPPSDDEWNANMDKIRDDTKQKVNKNIDEAFATLKQRGNKNKGERPVLQLIANGLNVVAVKLSDFLKKAIAWLEKALKTIWETVKKAAEWVWDKIKKAANALGAIFGL